MFNKQPYNRGKFNVSSAENRTFSGDANMNIGAAGQLTITKTMCGNSLISIFTSGKVIKAHSLGGGGELAVGAAGKYDITKTMRGDIDLLLVTSGKAVKAHSLSGGGEITISAAAHLNVIRTARGDARMSLTTSGKLVKMHTLKGKIDTAISTNDPALIRERRLECEAEHIAINVNGGNFYSYGYEYIKLSNLVLKPNDELIINTGEMTVEINGQNVIQYFSNDGEFFSIKPGENIVVYENGNVNSKANIKILWKDAFL